MNLTPEQLKAEREAFSAYIKACDDYCTEPDAATAFIFAWRRAAQAQRADVQEAALEKISLFGELQNALDRIARLEAESKTNAMQNVTLFAEWQEAGKKIARLEGLCKQAEEALTHVPWHGECGDNDMAVIAAALASLREKGWT